MDSGKGWQARKGLPTANVAPGNAAESAWQGSQCLGADTLMQLLKNYARSSGIKTAITVGESAPGTQWSGKVVGVNSNLNPCCLYKTLQGHLRLPGSIWKVYWLCLRQ